MNQCLNSLGIKSSISSGAKRSNYPNTKIPYVKIYENNK